MLKKLLKYDLKNIFKFLSVFYILAIFFALLTRIFLHIENSFILHLIGQICSGATISMIVSIFINVLMRNWVRFKNNLYGDEAYLMHTLPVTKKDLYQSKIITALTSLLISTLVITLTLLIAYYSKENITILKKLLLPTVEAYHSTILKFIFIVILVLFLEFVNIQQVGYTGIILGHKKNNHKLLYSVFFGFGTYLLLQSITLLALFLFGLFNSEIMNLFFTNEIVNLELLKMLMYMAIVTYTILIIITWGLNINFLNKGVNVD